MAKPELAVRDARAPATATNMANRFQRYKPEEEKIVRKVEVAEEETLRQLKTAWKTYVYSNDWEVDYARMVHIVGKLRYSAKDVEGFAIALVGFQAEESFPDKAGLFLSALINQCKDREFILRLAHLDEPINYLGYDNTKDIVIEGNAGNCAGFYMKSGAVTVKGNAGLEAGMRMTGGTLTIEGNAGRELGKYMDGGSITVEGDVGAWVGEFMGGGTIIVRGDAGENVGFVMNGGEIHLEGSYITSYITIDVSARGSHAKIYHKGELIVGR